jgi:hypothetical protein
VEIVTARRQKDIIIVVVQNNLKKEIIIEDMNHAAESILLYSRSELKNENFFKIINDDAKQKIENYIEYENYGIDIESILSKINAIYLVNKNQQKIKVKTKVFPVMSKNKDEIKFEILAREPDCIDKLIEFRQKVKDFEHSIDAHFQIMDKSATQNEIKLLSTFCEQYDTECIMCIIEFKHFSHDAVENIIKKFRKNTRSYDEIGLVDDLLVMFLVGCSNKNAEQTVKRIFNKFKEVSENITLYYFNLYNHPIHKPENILLANVKVFSSILK